jgi:hypothetical protein
MKILSERKWKYPSIELMAVLSSIGILTAIPVSEGAVPEVRGSLLDKILLALETTHGVLELDMERDMPSGGYGLEAILTEEDGYFGEYNIRVKSGGQRVVLECGSSGESPLLIVNPGANKVFKGSYACNGLYLSVEDDHDGVEDRGSIITGTISFTRGTYGVVT